MKSREEILSKYRDILYNIPPEFEQLCMDSMTEYADKFAVEFAEWCTVNRYSLWRFDGLWHKEGKTYTTTDLLTIFKKERGLE